MLVSRDVLEAMMGKEEALEVMLKNPAVLQCGPSLDTIGPDEIKGFANIRSFGNRLFPESARGPALTAFLALCFFPLIANNIPALQDSWALNLAKPLVGLVFALAIEGSRIVIVGTIVKAKTSADPSERLAIEKAQAAEKRRMGNRS